MLTVEEKAFRVALLPAVAVIVCLALRLKYPHQLGHKHVLDGAQRRLGATAAQQLALRQAKERVETVLRVETSLSGNIGDSVHE